MIRILIFLLIVISCKPNTKEAIGVHQSSPKFSNSTSEYAMVIHGGAGTILKKNMTLVKEKAYEKALTSALKIGQRILADGGSSTQAVVETISYMENSPLFNAGNGAVFANNGMNEMDASIMTGKDLKQAQ